MPFFLFFTLITANTFAQSVVRGESHSGIYCKIESLPGFLKPHRKLIFEADPTGARLLLLKKTREGTFPFLTYIDAANKLSVSADSPIRQGEFSLTTDDQFHFLFKVMVNVPAAHSTLSVAVRKSEKLILDREILNACKAVEFQGQPFKNRLAQESKNGRMSDSTSLFKTTARWLKRRKR